MKIFYFIEGTFNSGGIERIIINKANWLASKGHDVFLITTEQNGRDDFFPLENVTRIDFDLMYSRKTGNFLKDYLNTRKLIKTEKKLIEKLIEEKQPDIMISTFRYENFILPELKDNSKKIAEIHFSRSFRLNRKRKGITRLKDIWLTKQDIKQAKKFEKFICLTEEDKLNWKGLSNISVINNFIENKTSKPAELNNKSFIAVGRLSYEKGFDRLIDAWKILNEKFPEWKLQIYGSGPLKSTLEEQINNLGLNNYVNINPPTKNIHQKYLENSGLIISSHYEGLPMVMLEAMEAGLPIISFDFKCGPKDVIINEKNGLIIKNNDIKGLAGAIERLIIDDNLRKKMGNYSFIMAKKYYKELIMKQWDDLFQTLTNKKN